MISTITKRDGRKTEFNKEKIAQAIFKAAAKMGGNDYNLSESLANQVVSYLENEDLNENVTVEHVQDVVEKVLIENGHAQTAKEYILFRADRTRVREMNTRLMKIYEGLTFKLAKDNDVKRENANIDGDTAMGTMLKYGSEGAKQFYEMYILDPRFAKAHADGDIHIHDLDFLTLTTTCCQIDLDKLFTNGFSTGHGFLREPNDIISYSALACIAIQANQNDRIGFLVTNAVISSLLNSPCNFPWGHAYASPSDSPSFAGIHVGSAGKHNLRWRLVRLAFPFA